MFNYRERPYHPVWAPVVVDVSLGNLRPLPGWVILQERFIEDEERADGLTIARPGVVNTTTGVIVALSPETGAELGVSMGDNVVYREWQGGRWLFNGVPVLITASEHIVAKLEEGSGKV